MLTTKRSAAAYGLESSDSSDTPVKNGAAVRAGEPDLTVPMPVLAYKTMMCALVCGACIGLYLSLYRSVFDCMGLILVNVFASVLARVEKQRHVFGQYLHVSLFHKYQIPTQYMPIHAAIYWHVLNT